MFVIILLLLLFVEAPGPPVPADKGHASTNDRPNVDSDRQLACYRRRWPTSGTFVSIVLMALL